MDYNLKVIYPNHQKYAPAFLMRSGTDVRGLSLWLNKKGLKTKIYEYREEVPQTVLDPSHQIVLKKDDFVA